LNCNCFIHLYTCKHYRFLHTSHVTVWRSRSPPFQRFNTRTKLVLTISIIITFLGALLFNASCPNLSPYNYSKICRSVADPGCLSRIRIFSHPGSRIQKNMGR
jgi:hypothetical protein